MPAKAIFTLATFIWSAGSFADLRSTDVALHRPGVVEANPLFGQKPSDVRLYAEGAAISTGFWLGARHLWNHGHKRAAVAMLVGGGLTRAAVAERNRHVGSD
jgi:hypothetical protein